MMTTSYARTRLSAALLLMLVLLGGARSAGAAVAAGDTGGAPAATRTASGWVWPVLPPTVLAPWVAPAHEYGPGHRGIDLRAAPGAAVATPAAGTVAFAGTVADRALVTIDHGGGLVTTLEPVRATVAIGAVVAAGEAVGTVDIGGHAPLGAVHFGVRRDGDYINPMVLFGAIPRAVLLPCC